MLGIDFPRRGGVEFSSAMSVLIFVLAAQHDFGPTTHLLTSARTEKSFCSSYSFSMPLTYATNHDFSMPYDRLLYQSFATGIQVELDTYIDWNEFAGGMKSTSWHPR
ncbi:uncharacterized protein EV420DRAFT_1642488 [Desarmillaria tabescens]|uniref:Uncharacterized protein n=1 Tax=Armillaria tabescens TaxID=1929756 RepID=A0AA39KCR3_ARMTA|nr:uncharacterized protein EV420DRAFT_1642488 [Desarmillaria tabescens]KAK0458766.1 hypothetical protein EV420DRAFT_1642488 [Desarmillaria tabescens]